jgi:hypothetical protein
MIKYHNGLSDRGQRKDTFPICLNTVRSTTKSVHQDLDSGTSQTRGRDTSLTTTPLRLCARRKLKPKRKTRCGAQGNEWCACQLKKQTRKVRSRRGVANLPPLASFHYKDRYIHTYIHTWTYTVHTYVHTYVRKPTRIHSQNWSKSHSYLNKNKASYT